MSIKVLVANRGEIACRILRACREAGHPTVAVCAANDVGGLFTEMADEVVLLNGESIGETYLDQEQIIKAALQTGRPPFTRGLDCLLYTSPSPRDQ